MLQITISEDQVRHWPRIDLMIIIATKSQKCHVAGSLCLEIEKNTVEFGFLNQN